jgi:hypothetical protein
MKKRKIGRKPDRKGPVTKGESGRVLSPSSWESFDSWCRRQGLGPDDPTPAIVSPSMPAEKWQYETAQMKLHVGRGSVPSLRTDRQAFCLRQRRVFAVNPGNCWYDFYVRDRDRREVLACWREFIKCPHCPGTHILVSLRDAALLNLVDAKITREDRRFFTRFARPQIQFKKFPVIPREHFNSFLGSYWLKPEKGGKATPAAARKAATS